MFENNNSFIGHDVFYLKEFKFESGETLKDVAVEYSARGNPKFDCEGNITNMIIYCHKFNGNYSSILDLSFLLGEGKLLDLNEYYFVSITSLGFPESCSPSTTNLKHNFPIYSIKDRVNFKKQFLKECFNIEGVLGIIGEGVGGYECYTWACEYPDEMEFLIIVGSSYKTNGYRYVVSKCMESIIESSDDFYSDVYSESLSRIMVSINRLLYSNYFSKKIFQNLSNDQIDVLMDDFVDEGLFIDIYDFKYRNESILKYNVEDKLGNITADTLIISSNDDIYYTPEFDVLPLKGLIKNSKVVIFEQSGDYMDYEDYSIIEKDLKEFLDKLKLKKE